MRRNIVLDEGLVAEAFKHAKVATKKALIHVALCEFVAHHGRRDLRELRGHVRFRPGYDHKALRRGQRA